MKFPAVVPVFSFCLVCGWIAGRADAQTTQPASQPATTEPADQAAVKRGRNGQPDGRFTQLHDAFLWRGKEAPIGLLFLGDSITEGWIHNAKNQAPDGRRPSALARARSVSSTTLCSGASSGPAPRISRACRVCSGGTR